MRALQVWQPRKYTGRVCCTFLTSLKRPSDQLGNASAPSLLQELSMACHGDVYS